MQNDQSVAKLLTFARSLRSPRKLNFFHSIEANNIVVPSGASFDYIQLAHELNQSRIGALRSEGAENALELLYVEIVSEARFIEEAITEKLKDD